MSTTYFPECPWQNGMPPFGFCQQPFNPMMNSGPMWVPQRNLAFMAGSMPADIMRFGGNVPFRPNFRRSLDQMPDRYRLRQTYGDRYKKRQGRYGLGERKRPGLRERSWTPSRWAGPRRNGGRKVDAGDLKKGAASKEGTLATEEEAAEDAAGHCDDHYDPAEPTTEDTVQGGEVAGGQDDSDEAAQEGSDDDVDQEPGSSADKDKPGGREGGASTSAAISCSKLPAEPATTPPVPEASETNNPSKAADGKGQAGGRPYEKGRQEEGIRRSDQKDKGWCTVCEIHFDGSFLDHRRTEDHKIKRDEKYPKCHPYSMGFNNPKQYDHHCAGDLLEVRSAHFLQDTDCQLQSLQNQRHSKHLKWAPQAVSKLLARGRRHRRSVGAQLAKRGSCKMYLFVPHHCGQKETMVTVQRYRTEVFKRKAFSYRRGLCVCPCRLLGHRPSDCRVKYHTGDSGVPAGLDRRERVVLSVNNMFRPPLFAGCARRRRVERYRSELFI